MPPPAAAAAEGRPPVLAPPALAPVLTPVLVPVLRGQPPQKGQLAVQRTRVQAGSACGSCWLVRVWRSCEGRSLSQSQSQRLWTLRQPGQPHGEKAL